MAAIDDVLARARQGWDRIGAEAAFAQHRAGRLLLVDTRTETQRRETGELPGALVVDLTVLEWRLDPTAATCIPEASDRPRIAVVCRQGFSSSLAARRLRDLGLRGQDGAMTASDPTPETDALQQEFVAARERLSIARATLDQYASSSGQPIDSVPEEPAYVVNPAYDTAREEFERANAEFVRLEELLKPSWAEQGETPVEPAGD